MTIEFNKLVLSDGCRYLLNVILMALKWLFFDKNLKKLSSGWGRCCLIATFFEKNYFNFRLKSPLSKILVACLHYISFKVAEFFVSQDGNRMLAMLLTNMCECNC